MTESETFSAYVTKSVQAGTLCNLVFSAPKKEAQSEILKIRGDLRVIRGTLCLQLEQQMTEGRVTQENLSPEEIGAKIEEYFGAPFTHIDLNDKNGAATLMMSKKGKVTLVLPASLRQALDNSAVTGIAAAMESFGANNREKQHVLTGAETFLTELGVSDRNGRVFDKKQAKFRQICRFTEIVMEELTHMPKEGTLLVADLCCGKSYLSFAVYHALTAIAGRKVEMICMDLKKSVMDFCAETARRLRYDGMQFLCGDITTFVPPRKPDLVLSLHACDTATDIVLRAAAKWEAGVILSTPCCQKDLSTKLDCPALAFIGDSPILRRNFCATATDALRLLYLESQSYKAQAMEFIDPEDTPKNIMLRAVRVRMSEEQRKKKADEYEAVSKFLTGGFSV